jgi:hypothetical protein
MECPNIVVKEVNIPYIIITIDIYTFKAATKIQKSDEDESTSADLSSIIWRISLPNRNQCIIT